MTSFYGGGGGGISETEAKELINQHIIFSKTEPTVQQEGDIWVIIGEFDDETSEALQALQSRRVQQVNNG